jgi:hypothetical protein
VSHLYSQHLGGGGRKIGRWWQEDWEFEATMGYIARVLSHNSKAKQNKTNKNPKIKNLQTEMILVF